MNRFRHKRRQIAHMQELPLTPLVDTALTLLIVFIPVFTNLPSIKKYTAIKLTSIKTEINK